MTCRPRPTTALAATVVAVLCGLGAGIAGAAGVQAALPPQASESATSPNEPVVRRTVIEDGNARVEELSVRGAVRSAKVQPKGPIRGEYEVLQPDVARDQSAGPGTGRGVAGQSVWRVLSF